MEKFYEKCGLETSPRPLKNDSKEVSLLVWTDFESFAITYPV